MPEGFRVEELARTAGVSVDTVRYYQHRGLLPPPQRQGRVAYYGHAHLDRLARIRELKERGLRLETIGRVLSGTDPSEAALLDAVSAAGTAGLSLADVAAQTGVALGLLESLVEEGLLESRPDGGERAYGPDDVRAVRAGMALLEAGVPLPQLLDLGRRYATAVDAIAEDAVTLFNDYVRHPTEERSGDPADATGEVLAAFQRLLPAASELVRHNFERAVLAAARRRLGDGS